MTQWMIILSLLATARTKQFQVFLSMFISPIVFIGDQGLSIYLKITQSQGWFTKEKSLQERRLWPWGGMVLQQRPSGETSHQDL